MHRRHTLFNQRLSRWVQHGASSVGVRVGVAQPQLMTPVLVMLMFMLFLFPSPPLPRAIDPASVILRASPLIHRHRIVHRRAAGETGSEADTFRSSNKRRMERRGMPMTLMLHRLVITPLSRPLLHPLVLNPLYSHHPLPLSPPLHCCQTDPQRPLLSPTMQHRRLQPHPTPHIRTHIHTCTPPHPRQLSTSFKPHHQPRPSHP